MSAIKPFKINVSEGQLDDLHSRLKNTIWPSIIEGQDEQYGPKLSEIKDLTEKLLKFDWRKTEAELNKLPHFITEIDNQDIHFIHSKSDQEGATPLLLIHGWPGSFVEFVDVIVPLNKAGYDVVVPSLPGFGFSGPTHEAGWNHGRISKALLELMERLGYETFGIQGGDAGAIVGPEIARMAPERVTGVHLNAATMGFIPMGPVDEATIAAFTPAEKVRMQRMQDFMQTKFGFNLLQSNQPQLVAYALSDSPVGLLAWITQLFPGSLERQFLTNFMVYWVTGTAASSIRMYFEGAHDPAAWAPKANSGVPTAVAVFQDEDIAIRAFGEDGNNIVRWNEFEEGGHYAVMAAESVWLKDVVEFFDSLKK